MRRWVRSRAKHRRRLDRLSAKVDRLEDLVAEETRVTTAALPLLEQVEGTVRAIAADLPKRSA